MSDPYPAKSRYQGDVARGYDKNRTGRPKWEAEQRAMSTQLKRLARGDRLVDVPFGTGRFTPYYEELGLQVIGVDVSRDMMREVGDSKAIVGRVQGEIERLPLADGAVEHALCVRLANWLPGPVLSQALSELLRVSRERVLLHVRVSEPMSPWQRIRRWLPRRGLRSQSKGREPGHVVHPATWLEELFTEHGLSIAAQEDVSVEIDAERGEQHPLRIYLLDRGQNTASRGD